MERGSGPADDARTGQDEQESPRPEPPFVYTERDFIRSGVGWSGSGSRLDRALLSAWARRLAAGCFRYPLRGPEMPSRELPGPRRLLAQLNARRASQRRPPQTIAGLRQPFDPQRFNFTRVPAREILFPLRRGGGTEARVGGQPDPEAPPEAQAGAQPEARVQVGVQTNPGGVADVRPLSEAKDQAHSGARTDPGAQPQTQVKPEAQAGPLSDPWTLHEGQNQASARPEDRAHSRAQLDPDPLPEAEQDALLIINDSPLEQGHVLLVPEPEKLLPQTLTRASVLRALELVLLSSDPAFRVGFNSLGAFASVNHLHLHGFYLRHRLEVEWAPTEPLGVNGAGPLVHRLCGHYTRALVLYSDGGDYEEVADTLLAIIHLLLDRSVAHNLLLTRGCALGPQPPDPDSRDGVRLILWPRRSCFGAKDGSAFNVAFCELAGFLPVKTAPDFETLTEESALRIIGEHLLPAEEFQQLCTEITGLSLH